MPILTQLKEFLDRNNVAYEVLTHPEAFTAQQVAEAQHVPGREIAKVVIVRSGAEFAMTVLPAPARLDLERARGALGKPDLALATEQEFAGLFPQCQAGAMPPFGNLYGLSVWVDEGLTADDKIVFNAGTHTDTVRLRYSDFARLVQPKVARLAVER
jgi:Ala-tRNA(Pro) deacylase